MIRPIALVGKSTTPRLDDGMGAAVSSARRVGGGMAPAGRLGGLLTNVGEGTGEAHKACGAEQGGGDRIAERPTFARSAPGR